MQLLNRLVLRLILMMTVLFQYVEQILITCKKHLI